MMNSPPKLGDMLKMTTAPNGNGQVHFGGGHFIQFALGEHYCVSDRDPGNYGEGLYAINFRNPDIFLKITNDFGPTCWYECFDYLHPDELDNPTFPKVKVCNHEFKWYRGFTDNYEYCVHCDKKGR